MPLGLGMIGCGKMARELATALREAAPEARLVAGYDSYAPAREDFCAHFAVQGAATMEDLLARPGLGAVLVASPNHLHKDHTLAAAAADKHVFCEKPMALSVADCDAMLAACRGRRLKLMVGHSRRLAPEMCKLRDLVASGELGRPLHAQAGYWFGGFQPRASGAWHLTRAQCGGLLYQMGIHYLDVFHALFGPARRVQYAGSRLGQQVLDFDDLCTALLEYDAGVTAALSVSSLAPVGSQEISVLFTRGYARWASDTGALEFGPDFESRTALGPNDLRAPDGVQVELASFVRWILHDETPVLTGAEGRAAVAVAEAADRAKETGAAVEIGGK